MIYLSTIAILLKFTQAEATSVPLCGYTSTGGVCNSTTVTCTELCDDLDDCVGMSCAFLKIAMAEFGMSEWDECFIRNGQDLKISCEDSGSDPCDGTDLCLTQCFNSSDLSCGGNCITAGYNLEGEMTTCEEMVAYRVPDQNVTWGECFDYNGTDASVVCQMGSGSSTDNFGMIVIIIAASAIAIGIVAIIFKKVCAKKNL